MTTPLVPGDARAGRRLVEATEVWLFVGFLGFYVLTGGRDVAAGPRVGAAALGALTCALGYRLCRRAGAASGPARLAALFLGTTTLLWPAARHDVVAVAQAALFTGYVEALLARAGVAAGAAAGLLVCTDPLFGLAALGGAVLLRGDRRALLHAAATFASLALVAAFIGAPAPDLARYREHLLDGLWGLLLSTGKGVFFYSPPLLAGLALLARPPRAFLVTLALTVTPIILVHALDVRWSGGLTWGVPALLFLHPALLVPVALALRSGLPIVHRLGLGLTLAGGLFVQIVAVSLAPGHWMAIAHQAGLSFLGKPDLRGSELPCLSCFEVTHRLDWLPPFQPILGQWWLLEHVVLGDDYHTADADAPWRRYTRLDVKAADAYRRAQLDWWPLALLRPGGRR